MKILVLGTRGLSAVAGGIENHCKELYPRLVRLGCTVHVIARGLSSKQAKPKSYRGVKVSYLRVPYLRGLQPLLHTLLGILYAALTRPDVVHIHAIGPALMTGVARIFGLRVVVTHHGRDYQRRQWGRIASSVLRLGERQGLAFANHTISVSEVVRADLKAQSPCRPITYIPNGVVIPHEHNGNSIVECLGLLPRKYILGVGRFVEDKGFHDLIAAYSRLDTTEYKLVLVGGIYESTEYSRSLESIAEAQSVILSGMLFDEQLAEVFSHAAVFVLPSYFEAQSITLLEAMSYRIDVLASDIPANLAVGLESADYFPVGDVAALANSIEAKLTKPQVRDYREKLQSRHDLDVIASQTFDLYREVVTGQRDG